MNGLKEQKPAILCGDLNVAHNDIDLYKTKGMEKYAGFTPEER
jgi:exodeoxyribonuclease-3